MDNPQSQTALLVAIIAASATVIVAIIGSIITGWNNRLARKSDHKLAILKVLLEAGYKEYEFRAKQDLEANADDTEVRIKSFTEYIIFYRELSELFAKDKVTTEELKTSLKNNKTLIDSYYKNRDIYRPEYHKS